MQAIIWKWLWRFCGAAVALTVLFALVAGVVLRHLLSHLPAWLGGPVALVAVLIVGGLMLPAFQRDMERARRDGEDGGA